MCSERGIQCDNLRKQELIQALRSDEDNDVCDVDDNDNNDLNDRVEDTDDDDDCNDEIEIGDHLLSGDRQADVSGGLRADGREPESETVIALRLKLALIQEEREAERERFEREKERYQMLGGTRAGNGNDASNELDYRDIKSILPTMHDEDVLSFFMAYERVMCLHEVERSVWAKYLPAQLSPKALKTFSRLSLEESRDYDTIKDVILTSYKLDADSYLKTFRTMRRAGQVTYKMHLTNTREILWRYIDASRITDFDSLYEAILKEQFMNSLPSDVQGFVLAKEPISSDDCARLADLSFQVSRLGRDANYRPTTVSTQQHQSGQAVRGGNNNHYRRPAGIGQRPWGNHNAGASGHAATPSYASGGSNATGTGTTGVDNGIKPRTIQIGGQRYLRVTIMRVVMYFMMLM